MGAALPIYNGFYVNKSLPVSNQQAVNCHVQNVDAPGLSDQIIIGTPGIELILSTGIANEDNRGAYVKNGIPYFVNGQTLYRLNRSVDVDGVETFTTDALGTIPEPVITQKTRVSMATNGTQLIIIVPGSAGYIYNEDATPAFAQITDADFTASGNPQHVVFIDGYFAVTTDSKKWIVSALNDGLSWNALDFSTAEADPDVIIAPAVVKNQIYILGQESTEAFQNIGGSGFPFVRSGVFAARGCYAPFSIVSAHSSFFMIGGGKNETPAVWQHDGNDYQKISNNAVDYLLSQLTPEEMAAVYGWSYAQEGCYFVGWTLPTVSVCFEITTGKWHTRQSLIFNELTAWRATAIVTAYNRIIVADEWSGSIGTLKTDYFKEYNTNIVRILVTQPFSNAGKEVLIPKLELTMEAGVGDNDTPSPKIALSTSKDGKTFNHERVRSIGRKGQYNLRSVWRKNGRFSRWAVLKFLFSDPVKFVICKLEAE